MSSSNGSDEQPPSTSTPVSGGESSSDIDPAIRDEVKKFIRSLNRDQFDALVIEVIQPDNRLVGTSAGPPIPTKDDFLSNATKAQFERVLQTKADIEKAAAEDDSASSALASSEGEKRRARSRHRAKKAKKSKRGKKFNLSSTKASSSKSYLGVNNRGQYDFSATKRKKGKGNSLLTPFSSGTSSSSDGETPPSDPDVPPQRQCILVS